MSTEPPRRERRSSWPVALIAVALIAAAATIIIFLRVETWPARTVRDLRAAFIDIAHLQPKITIKNRVYLEQTAPTAELATVVRRTEIEHEFLHSWAGSTKRIKLRGAFLVKAGFDLHKNFSVDVRANEIDVHLPPAQILGVEEQKVEVLSYENGYWNRISADDIESELQSLPQLAREKAAQAGLIAEAERTLKEQLEQKIKLKQRLKVNFDAARVSVPTPAGR